MESLVIKFVLATGGLGLVVWFMWYMIKAYETGKIRRGGDFETLQKEHDKDIADKDAQLTKAYADITYLRAKCDATEGRLYEALAKLRDAREFTEETENKLKKDQDVGKH